jgi:hypothetical protein
MGKKTELSDQATADQERLELRKQTSEEYQALSGAAQSLLVCCSAFRGVEAVQAAERCPNLMLKNIPKMVLARCEWGHDDYSLNGEGRKGGKRGIAPAGPDLFGEVDGGSAEEAS